MVLIDETVIVQLKQLTLVLAGKLRVFTTTPCLASQYLASLSTGGSRWRVRNGARTCSSVQRPLLNSTQNRVRVKKQPSPKGGTVIQHSCGKNNCTSMYCTKLALEATLSNNCLLLLILQQLHLIKAS